MKRPGKPKCVITPHRDFFYPTIDDWYPNFPRDTVQIRVHDQTTGDNVFIRISVWGYDDCGMEKDFYVSLAEKDATLKQVIKLADNLPNPITKAWLKSQGFVRA